MRQLLARIISMFRGSADDADFAQELESHVEMLAADNVARGISPAEARRAARIRLGAATSLATQHRDARGLPMIEDLWQDLRFAARLIARDKWFSAAAVMAIALGIGANTVGFTIVNAAFIRGFAFERVEELHAISWRPTRGRRLPSSVMDLEDWRSRSQRHWPHPQDQRQPGDHHRRNAGTHEVPGERRQRALGTVHRRRGAAGT